MITLIVLLWIAIQMKAPTWVCAILIFGIVMDAINIVLTIIDKHLEKKLDEEIKAQAHKELEAMWGRGNAEEK